MTAAPDTPAPGVADIARRRRAALTGQTLLLLALVAAVSVGLALVLGRTGERIATQLAVNVAAVVALGAFTGNSGVVSFGHAAFMAIGAYASGILTMPAMLQRSALPMLPEALAGFEWPLWAAFGAVVLLGAAVGFVVGLPVSRLVGASATISTLGLLIIAHSVLIGAREITRGAQTFYGVPRETTLALATGAALVMVLVARLYRESRWGLRLRAVRDDEAAAVAVGIDPRRARLIGFALSAAMATLAGALYGHMLGAFSPHTFYFGLTFALVAMLIVGGMATVGGAVIGVMLVTLLQDLVRQAEGGFTLFGVEAPEVFGLTTVALGVVILLVIRLRPEGLLGVREAEIPGLARLIAPLMRPRPPAAPARPEARDSLVVEGLSKRFEGLVAVDGASFAAPPGKVTGLIGPNGAGKSTIVNLLTGHLPPSGGSMRFGAAALNGVPPHRIAGLGLARTFQNNRLFDNLTVFENVLVAALARARRMADAEALALRELAAMDLTDHAGALASGLPYGVRKRLEIARCLALEPRLILLDEPAAGMNPEETAELAKRLDALLRERGIGLLLIDHDLEFVHRLSNAIVVVNRGRVIADGAPDEIRADPAVIEAYVGRGRRGAARKPTGETAVLQEGETA